MVALIITVWLLIGLISGILLVKLIECKPIYVWTLFIILLLGCFGVIVFIIFLVEYLKLKGFPKKIERFMNRKLW